MTISNNFFNHPSKIDRANDMKYCKENSIETEGKSREEIKGAILESMTDKELGANFFKNKGPMDLFKDLQKLEELGLENTGSRAGNKAAITNSYLA